MHLMWCCEAAGSGTGDADVEVVMKTRVILARLNLDAVGSVVAGESTLCS